MTGVEPLDLAAAVQAVAVVLAGQPVVLVGLAGRAAYTFESTSAVVTVSVHLDTALDTDRAADLLNLGEGTVSYGDDLYSRGGLRDVGVYVSLYGPPHRTATVAGVAS